MEPLLQVQGLVKRFGKRTVLNGLNFVQYEGENVVLTGVNGSGKSTLLRIICGLLPADEGNVRLMTPKMSPSGKEGEAPGQSTSLSSRDIGYVPERMPFLRFTPEEYLRHMGAIRGMDPKTVEGRIDTLLKLSRLDSARHAPIRHFSKGMLQKVGIIQALLGRPRLLLMDEPFSGLDVQSKEELVQLLQRLGDTGMSLMYASHEPELAEGLATRMLALGTDGKGTDRPVQKRDVRRMLIRTSGLDRQAAVQAAARAGGCPITEEGGEIWFLPDVMASDSVLMQILAAGGSVLGVRPEQELRRMWTEAAEEGERMWSGLGEEQA